LNDFLEKIECEGQHNECKSNPLGPSGEGGIKSLGLCLEGIAVVAAADGTAETGALAGLEHDDNNQTETDEQLNDGEYEFNDFH